MNHPTTVLTFAAAIALVWILGGCGSSDDTDGPLDVMGSLPDDPSLTSCLYPGDAVQPIAAHAFVSTTDEVDVVITGVEPVNPSNATVARGAFIIPVTRSSSYTIGGPVPPQYPEDMELYALAQPAAGFSPTVGVEYQIILPIWLSQDGSSIEAVAVEYEVDGAQFREVNKTAQVRTVEGGECADPRDAGGTG